MKGVRWRRLWIVPVFLGLVFFTAYGYLAVFRLGGVCS